jgi:hypothetical protein
MRVFQVQYTLKEDHKAPIFGKVIIAEDYGEAETEFKELVPDYARILIIKEVAQECHIAKSFTQKPVLNFVDLTAPKNAKPKKETAK